MTLDEVKQKARYYHPTAVKGWYGFRPSVNARLGDGTIVCIAFANDTEAVIEGNIPNIELSLLQPCPN